MSISYIIYTSNSEKYIGKILNKILDKMNENDELIIIDDLSTDNTIPTVVGLVGYMWVDEKHYKLFINTDKKGKRKSIEMAKNIATCDFKYVVNKK